MSGWRLSSEWQVGSISSGRFLLETRKLTLADAPEGVQSAFKTMRLIVLVGWAIYPIGYVVGYAGDQVDAGTLNGIYNIADFINKIAFGLMIWAAATSSRKEAA
jgi:bacteriorhodopsin